MAATFPCNLDVYILSTFILPHEVPYLAEMGELDV
jgi:hypothetical protein